MHHVGHIQQTVAVALNPHESHGTALPHCSIARKHRWVADQDRMLHTVAKGGAHDAHSLSHGILLLEAASCCHNVSPTSPDNLAHTAPATVRCHQPAKKNQPRRVHRRCNIIRIVMQFSKAQQVSESSSLTTSIPNLLSAPLVTPPLSYSDRTTAISPLVKQQVQQDTGCG